MSALDLLALLAGAPFAAILALLTHYVAKRTVWKHNRRRGKPNLGFCPSSAALGVVFLFAQVFVRPSLDQTIHAIQHEDVDEHDEGDPEESRKHFLRQLRKIRHGRPIDRLVLKLTPSAPTLPLKNYGKIESGDV